MRAHVIAIFAAGFVLVAACGGKKPGASCQGTDSTCMDKKTALACHGGKYAEVACAGPTGCAKYKDHANCDTTVANTGDACMGEDDEYACTPDSKRVLGCKNGHYETLFECRGKGGCSIAGKAYTCDTSVAQKGDPCKAGTNACSVSGDLLFACNDGKFGLHRYCRGAKGCTVTSEGPTCDESIALIGDPCGVSGRIACGNDGKTQLICQGGTYAKSLTCKTACVVTNKPGHAIDCQ